MTKENRDLQQLDQLCDQFEAALRKGDTTLIEDYLPKIPDEQRTQLLQELLQVEIQFAAEKDAAGSLSGMRESFKKRFPAQTEFINALFDKLRSFPPETGKNIADYELLGELGHGGMGIVYKAKHKLLQQTVAVKVLPQTLTDDPQAVGRFKREMQLVGGLSHPNIVRALNAGEAGGTLYLAMEFIDGITLQKLAELRKPPNSGQPVIPVGAACEAVRQAALGLQNAHELKLVHRDIKPANLMTDRHGTVKVLDLGLGKFAEEQRDEQHSSLTMPNMTLGTVDYISPEQCENAGEADIRSDLYSLGCSLFFLLTGKAVYSGSRYDSVRKKLMGHIVGEIPALRQSIPSAPAELEKLLRKMLAKDPAERFQTPQEFADALVPFASFDEFRAVLNEALPAEAGGLPSTAKPSGNPYLSRSLSPQQVRQANKWKWIRFFAGLHLLVFGAVIGVILCMQMPEFGRRIDNDVKDLDEKASTFLLQWNVKEAQTEYNKNIKIRAEEYLKRNDNGSLIRFLSARLHAAETLWFQGDSRRANREVQSVLDTINSQLSDEQQKVLPEAAPLKGTAVLMRADTAFFGGAASGTGKDRFADRIILYSEAAKLLNDRTSIRCKQIILLLLNGETEKAQNILEEWEKKENPGHLAGQADPHVSLPYQLMKAVFAYYQPENDDRTAALRQFLKQFSIQSNPASEAAKHPYILELLLFTAEFLIHDSLQREDWQTLTKDISSFSRTTLGFVRQFPGSRPFLRRYAEILIRSAALLYEKSETQKEKQEQLDTIVRILERMRLPDGGHQETRLPEKSEKPAQDISVTETPSLLLFFLPESNRKEEGFVLFYPQDGRDGTLFPLPVSRQMVKRREEVPPLDLPLAALLRGEKQSGRSVKISWNDIPCWARVEDAVTENDCPAEWKIDH
ncbi:MAG: serine/threonine protein kinase [Planctomycetaceae bacterium]|jgi:serine/threonine protein kinase|nr:serine/threonine protein kinase [Planctomycetaceae bacterium]